MQHFVYLCRGDATRAQCKEAVDGLLAQSRAKVLSLISDKRLARTIGKMQTKGFWIILSAMATAGLIYGKELHHLDHLAPLCALYGIPLILTDEEMVHLAQHFYLDLHIIHYDQWSAPEKVVANFDTLVYSTPRVLFDEVFYFAQAMYEKRIRTIWCPHGNSDKGRSTPFMEALAEEEYLFTYGPRMDAFLEEKGVKGKKIRLGNYRYAYYKKHKLFYDSLLPKKNKPTLLYAPTWQDQESNSSFAKLAPLLSQAPDDVELLIKLHPNLYIQYPEIIEALKSEGISFIEDFPPVYPLLARADVYIGDMSSVGYDFLAFKKPLLLLTYSPLVEAGATLYVEEYKGLFDAAKKLIGTEPPKQSLYDETFSRFSRKVPILN